MTAKRQREKRVRMMAAAVAAALCLSGPAALANDPPRGMGQPIQIYLDISRVLKMPERTATLVVGNPLIADVAVQAGGLMVVTGKGYGVTNLIAFDSKGALLMEHPIEVRGAVDKVTVYRGSERFSYSCLPDCERRVALGDSQEYFAGNLGQAGTLNAQAAGGAQPQR
jgi:Flp pilus assembly secretin CpaC